MLRHIFDFLPSPARRGFFAAFSGIQSQDSFRVESAAKSSLNNHKVLSGIAGSNSPKVLSGIPPSGVTRSHSVQNLDF